MMGVSDQNQTSESASSLPTGKEWVNAYAIKIGVRPPTDTEFAQLLELAGVAAHASERVAAPVACWLAAIAGLGPAEAVRLAAEVGK
jgi:Domain of unknown function (DUF6457)